MRILFITYSIKEEAGVGSARSRMLYDMLRDKGHSITLLSDSIYSLKNIFCYIVFRQYDKVYFSGPPYSYYLIILLVAVSLKKVNLIVDFRDPWSLHIANGYNNTVYKANKIKLKIAQLTEKMIYNISKHFVVCTEGMFLRYKELFKDLSKLSLILNGHEIEKSDLKNNLMCQKDDGYLKVVCLGKFAAYDRYRAIKLFNIFEIYSKKIEITFYGTDEITKNIVQSKTFKHLKFKLENSIPYNEIRKTINNYNFAILLLRNDDFEYGTKVYDYIGFGLPIYNIFNSNSLFYSKFKNYLFDDLNNIPKIKPDYEMKFSRRKQLKKLVKYIEE